MNSIAERCRDQPDPYAAACLMAIYSGNNGYIKTLHFNDGSCLSFKITYTATVVGRSDKQ